MVENAQAVSSVSVMAKPLAPCPRLECFETRGELLRLHVEHENLKRVLKMGVSSGEKKLARKKVVFANAMQDATTGLW